MNEDIIKEDFRDFVQVLAKNIKKKQYFALLFDAEENRFKSIGNLDITRVIGLLEITKIDLITQTKEAYSKINKDESRELK